MCDLFTGFEIGYFELHGSLRNAFAEGICSIGLTPLRLPADNKVDAG